jgi:hypothetical protein
LALKLTIFKTINEMETTRLQQAAGLDPVTGLARTVELILRVYGVSREQMQMHGKPREIIITKPDESLS